MTRDLEGVLRSGALLQRWRGRSAFVVLDATADGGALFEAVRSAWNADPARSRRLDYIAIDTRSPPSRELQRLTLDGGTVQRLRACGRLDDWLPQIVAAVDVFFVDARPARGDAATGARAERDAVRRCKALARLASADATLVVTSTGSAHAADVSDAVSVLDTADASVAADAVASLDTAAAAVAADAIEAATALLVTALRSVGFVALPTPHEPGAITTRYRPRPGVRSSPRGRIAAPRDGGRVVIVGAGLAGCAAAWALAERGIATTVVDRGDSVATGASAVAAGLFHATVHGADGVHARWHRAAAAEARESVAIAIEQHGAAGGLEGVLRLDIDAGDRPSRGPAARSVDARRELLQRLGLGDDDARAVDADEASRLAAVRLRHGGWFFPAGGWVDPRALARSFLARAGDATRLRLGCDVASLRRGGDGGWRLCDTAGREVESAATVVCANAAGACDLLGAFGSASWPLARLRGQLSVAPAAPGGDWPRLPIAGAGYVLPPRDGRVVIGATSTAKDDAPVPRLDDHRSNLARLGQLLASPPEVDAESLGGQVGWRLAADDRLPWIGAVPSAASATLQTDHEAIGATRLDAPRFVPREPGLFVFIALASRGITWAALGARLLASRIDGSPSPVPAALLDAVDPARAVSRRVRRSAGDAFRAGQRSPTQRS